MQKAHSNPQHFFIKPARKTLMLLSHSERIPRFDKCVPGTVYSHVGRAAIKTAGAEERSNL
jgi:hypothetical protein